MSKIPQLLHGNRLEHDIAFANDTSITGVVNGVQSITATGDITLSFDTTNTMLRAATVAIDAGGANRNVATPVELTSTNGVEKSLKGRQITFVNASTAGEALFIVDSAGNHICIVGYGDSQTVIWPSHAKPETLGSLRKHTLTLIGTALNTDTVIVPVDASFYVVPVSAKVIFTGTAKTLSGTVNIEVGAAGAAAEAVLLPENAVKVPATYIQTAAAAFIPVYGADLYFAGDAAISGGDATSKVVVEVYFHEFK
tara:strand:- start:434 stop:1195 length:762 start_codon:yes stop_codon:yes gene_type:complete